jgi:hypothetical protein
MKSSPPLPVFAYPRLSKTDLLFVRIGGDGLGNLMFSWARCLAASERHGWRMIWPTWPSFKPKNWRVNPYDHRTYFDLFRPTDRYVSGWRKPWCLARYRLIPEQQALAEGAPPGSVVQFRGMRDKFAPFLRDRQRVRDELLRIARPQHLAALAESAPAPIAIHVRCGDFVRQASYQDLVTIDNSLLPLDWYIAALQAVRSAAGRDLPAWVYSDGTTAELASLLALPGVARRDYGSGLGDMLGLSRARLLIASGSTFSMWGSFLGQVPTIWHPGKLLQHVVVEAPEKEIEWAPGDSLPGWVGTL